MASSTASSPSCSTRRKTGSTPRRGFWNGSSPGSPVPRPAGSLLHLQKAPERYPTWTPQGPSGRPPMELQVYIDGKFYPQSQAKVSVFDHGRLFKLGRHVERLFMSAKAISLDVGRTEEAVCEAILSTLRKNKIRDGYIRPVVTRGVGDIGIDPRQCTKGATLIVITVPFPALYGAKYEKGLKVVTASYRRVPPQSLSPSIKSLNYLN